MAEALKKLVTADLQEKLFPDNSFYNGAQSDAAGIDVESIDIPQDEDNSTPVIVNPTNFPLETRIEEDKKKTYAADLLATAPQLVTDLNQMLVSYDKRSAKLRKHSGSLETQLATRFLNAWAATKAEAIRQTTGGTTRNAMAAGATGTRKRAIKADFLYFMSLFNDTNIPTKNRRVVVNPYFYEDILAILEDQGKGAEYSKDLLEKGALTMIYSFNVFVRPTSETPTYTEAGTPVKKAVGAVGAATDNKAAIFYHPDFVRYIKGTPKVYINPDKGEYLGGTMNAAIRGGGTISRLSELGVGALVEDN